jgi:hypothetical protein
MNEFVYFDLIYVPIMLNDTNHMMGGKITLC